MSINTISFFQHPHKDPLTISQFYPIDRAMWVFIASKFDKRLIIIFRFRIEKINCNFSEIYI